MREDSVHFCLRLVHEEWCQEEAESNEDNTDLSDDGAAGNSRTGRVCVGGSRGLELPRGIAGRLDRDAAVAELAAGDGRQVKRDRQVGDVGRAAVGHVHGQLGRGQGDAGLGDHAAAGLGVGQPHGHGPVADTVDGIGRGRGRDLDVELDSLAATYAKYSIVGISDGKSIHIKIHNSFADQTCAVGVVGSVDTWPAGAGRDRRDDDTEVGVIGAVVTALAAAQVHGGRQAGEGGGGAVHQGLVDLAAAEGHLVAPDGAADVPGVRGEHAGEDGVAVRGGHAVDHGGGPAERGEVYAEGDIRALAVDDVRWARNGDLDVDRLGST